MTRIEEIKGRYEEELAIRHEDVRYLLAAAAAGLALAQELDEAPTEAMLRGFKRGALARYWAGLPRREPCNSSSPR